MAWLHRFSITHPKSVLVSAVIATLAAAPGLLHLRLRTDGHALVPPDAPEIAVDAALREEFGAYDPVVVLIRSHHPKGICNPDTVLLVQNLTRDFKKIRGVRPADVFSLATEHGHRVRPGTLNFRTFLEPLPRTNEQLITLHEDLRLIKLYTGTLVSYDGSATAIMVGVPPGTDRIELCGNIQDILDEQRDLIDETHIIGAPVAESLLGTHLLEDLGVPSRLLGFRTWAETDTAGKGIHFPASLYEFRRLLGRSVGLVPIAIVVMAVVFLISFRSVAATCLPLIEVAACLVFVFGLMGWTGVPVYLTIAVLPVILSAIGVADEIHVFTRFRELCREGQHTDQPQVVLATMNEMCAPVVKTSITTAVGFLSFALSPIEPVRVFGIFTAVGIIFCMLWSLTAIPALLVLLRLSWLQRNSLPQNASSPRSLRDFFGRFAGAVMRRRRAVIVVGALLLLVAPLGVRQVVIQDSWIDGFAPDSEFRRTTDFFNAQFLGTHMLLVCVDGPGQVVSGELTARDLDGSKIVIPADNVADPQSLAGQKIFLEVIERPLVSGPPRLRDPERNYWLARIADVQRNDGQVVLTVEQRHGAPAAMLRLRGRETMRFRIAPQPLADPKILRQVAALEDFIEGHRAQAVGGVLGTADYLATTNFIARGVREEFRTIPDDPDRIIWLWSQYERIRGADRRRQVIDENYDRALISVFLKDANFVDTRNLLDDIREYERTKLNPQDIRLEIGGDVAVSQTLIRAIVTTQVGSLAVSLVSILIVTTLLGRSAAWGALCVLPCAVGVILNFAVMGWTAMPLGVATSMFSGMTLGIGVDYAIHLLERYRLARARGDVREDAVRAALHTAGPAILIDALAVALGFGILTMSQVPANSRLGGLVVLSIINCFAATIFLLPALLSLRRRAD